MQTTPGLDTRAVVGVVGPRGFLGRHICHRLLEEGHTVHLFDRSTPAVSVGDVDSRLAASDVVVWAASTINPLIAANDPDRVALDTAAFASFVRAVRRTSDRPRIILLSSGGTVYDPAIDPPYSETAPVGPRSAYGQAKLALERLLLEHDDSALVLRVANAYGPGQPVAPGQGVIAHWLHAIASGQEVHLFGDPDVARDYVHVEDVARAVVAAVQRDYREHPVLNIGAGTPTTLKELFRLVAEATGASSLGPRLHPPRTFDARSTWLACERADRTLGWRPAVPLSQGILGTWSAVLAATPSLGRAARSTLSSGDPDLRPDTPGEIT